jgi:hypothetical protein
MSRRRSATTSRAGAATTALPSTCSTYDDSPSWDRRAAEALSAYAAARARAEGWDEDAVALLLAWLPRRAPDTPFRITERCAELELHGEVRLVIRRFVCPDYEPPPGSRRCRSFIAGGGCSRPEHPVCIEWQRANPDR